MRYKELKDKLGAKKVKGVKKKIARITPEIFKEIMKKKMTILDYLKQN